MNESMANIILNKVIETGEVVAKAVEKLDNHHALIVETRNDVKTIVSKQNADMVYFTNEKEAMYTDLDGRLKPLEADKKNKDDFKSDTKKKMSNIVWDLVKDGIKWGIMVLVTYLLLAYKQK